MNKLKEAKKRKRFVNKYMQKEYPEIYYRKKAKKLKLLKILVNIVLIIALIFLLKTIWENYETKKIEDNNSKINEIVKSSDIKSSDIEIHSKNNNLVYTFFDMMPYIENYYNSMDVYFDNEISLPEQLYIAEDREQVDKVIDKFIVKRNEPYKVKVMNTGASHILYQYGNYKVDTNSKAFKKMIIKQHDL